ncbi:MAG: EAL domain-containing protein [Acholeplasmatales bacterium]|nr:EAL domain-containing protein [Acholeplasmatales bacterium]
MDFVERFNDALDKGNIQPYFQPLTRTIPESICGVEALARWIDDDNKMIFPSDFIPKLEENRIIYKLDLAILEEVCKFYNKCQYKDIKFSINISGIDFEEIDMFDSITKIIEKYNVPSNIIHLEITETTMLYDTIDIRNIFKRFRDAGFEIWIDDFGSGYSSLNVLRDYSFNVLKMDMGLIDEFNINSKKIITSVINMSKKLGIRTLAEGVETEEQVSFLKNIGCEIIQGYYYAKPMPSKDFLEYLAKRKIETKDEYRYWNEVGKVNFLTADPLLSFNNNLINNDITTELAPLSFVEYEKGTIKYLYYNDTYARELKIIGYNSIDKLVDDVNNESFEYRQRYISQIKNTINRDGIQRVDNMINNVVFSHFTELISSVNDKYLIASSFYTLSSKRSDYLVLKYSQSLYMTYDTVTEITPDKDSAVQIYSTAGFAKVYGTVSLRKGIIEFAENEVHPSDKERYLKFFDLKTLKERIDDKYIHDIFSVRSGGSYEKKNIRITKLDNGKYLYTIQSL